MAWWLIPAGMAALGAIKGEKEKDAQVANNKLQAELTKYAPWTNQWGKISPVTGGFLEGAMQGGLSGLGLSQNMINANMMAGPKTAQAAPSTTELQVGWNALDGSSKLQQPQLGDYEFSNRRGYLR